MLQINTKLHIYINQVLIIKDQFFNASSRPIFQCFFNSFFTADKKQQILLFIYLLNMHKCKWHMHKYILVNTKHHSLNLFLPTWFQTCIKLTMTLHYLPYLSLKEISASFSLHLHKKVFFVQTYVYIHVLVNDENEFKKP